MEPIRVELQRKNTAYFTLLDDFIKRLKNSSNYNYTYICLQNEENVEELRKQFFKELNEKGIPDSKIIYEDCEMVHVNYDAFNCVLLHKDGTYTQHSLSEVKHIR